MDSPSQNVYRAELDQGHQSKRGNRPLFWLLGGCGSVLLLVCGGLFSFVMYLGLTAPETSVYEGKKVPPKFIKVMKEVGALEDGENIQFFYSDALTDIRESFCFVSDSRVVYYWSVEGEVTLESVEFHEIDEVELIRDESFFVDSELTLYLKDEDQYDGIVLFPVSSEKDRDIKFKEAIERGMEKSAR